MTASNELDGRLLADCLGANEAFAREAFGEEQPDAINFWLGPAEAVTSLHKDHYENIYAVLRGKKHFLLFPPTEIGCLRETKLLPAQYRQDDDGTFHIDRLAMGTRPWIAVDPEDPDLTRFPEFAHARAIKVTVEEGDLFYLPSLWYHQVKFAT